MHGVLCAGAAHGGGDLFDGAFALLDEQRVTGEANRAVIVAGARHAVIAPGDQRVLAELRGIVAIAAVAVAIAVLFVMFEGEYVAKIV